MMMKSGVNYSMPFPSVVRIDQYVNFRGGNIILNRKNILKRDGHQCQYCGRKNIPLTVDHVIPKVRGGNDTWENLVAACILCNNKKGNRTPKEANMILLKRPRQPNRILFIQRFVSNPVRSWRPYLFLE
jgi:5-methylcytosine-specific restriction endonuclease McrA